MTPRTTHIGASFAIVLVAYCFYALLAVPWIEPPPPPPSTRTATSPMSAMPQPNDLAVLFTPDRWELNDPKIINSNGQALLLFQKYENHPDGWVDLKPLTIIFMPDENVIDEVERLRHAVVMEVAEGANLRFDRPLDLSKGGIGKLKEGRLRGPVRIRSQGKRPDHQDDLLVMTHDVDLNEQRITTHSDVDFQWGPNSGRGSGAGDQALAPPGTSSRGSGRTEHWRHQGVPARTRRMAVPRHGFGLGSYGPGRPAAAAGQRSHAGHARRAPGAGKDHLPRAVPL